MASERSLFEEVERDLLGGKPIADLLRKCILASVQSGSSQLREWATKELNGYSRQDDVVPDYRIIRATIRRDGTTARGRYEGQRLFESDLPSFARDDGYGEHVKVGNPVVELEEMIAGKRSTDSVRFELLGSALLAEYYTRTSGDPSQRTATCVLVRRVDGALKLVDSGA